MSKESRKCKKMYFNELEMTEYDTRSVLEGKNKEFCLLPTSRGFPIIIVQHIHQLGDTKLIFRFTGELFDKLGSVGRVKMY